MSQLDRLLAKVEVDEETGCWVWTGYVCDRGYGRTNMMIDGVRYRLVHRAVYRLIVGGIGPELDHLCRNHSCVFPGHLDDVDHRTNMLRGDGWAGQHHRKTACPHGHPYSGPNLLVYRARRYCRTCMGWKGLRAA